MVHPADVPTTGKERASKCDKLRQQEARPRTRDRVAGADLRALLGRREQLRTLSRLRSSLATHQTRLKNRIKSMMAFYGYALPRRDEMCHWTAKFIRHLRELDFTDEVGRECLSYCLDELEDPRLRQAQVLKSLERHVAEADTEGVTDMLRTVPGVGRMTTLTLYCELVDMRRFRRFDQLASYVGLVPSMNDSGERQSRAGLSHRRNRHLRSILIEAAWVAVRRDPTLTASFAQLTRRMKKQEATRSASPRSCSGGSATSGKTVVIRPTLFTRIRVATDRQGRSRGRLAARVTHKGKPRAEKQCERRGDAKRAVCAQRGTHLIALHDAEGEKRFLLHLLFRGRTGSLEKMYRRV